MTIFLRIIVQTPAVCLAVVSKAHAHTQLIWHLFGIFSCMRTGHSSHTDAYTQYAHPHHRHYRCHHHIQASPPCLTSHHPRRSSASLSSSFCTSSFSWTAVPRSYTTHLTWLAYQLIVLNRILRIPSHIHPWIVAPRVFYWHTYYCFTSLFHVFFHVTTPHSPYPLLRPVLVSHPLDMGVNN